MREGGRRRNRGEGGREWTRKAEGSEKKERKRRKELGGGWGGGEKGGKRGVKKEESKPGWYVHQAFNALDPTLLTVLVSQSCFPCQRFYVLISV